MSVTKKVLVSADTLERLIRAYPYAHLSLHEQRRFDDIEDIRVPQEVIEELNDSIDRARKTK